MPMILQGDCLEIMKTLPDKSVDLFLCDLPYGCLGSQNNNARLMRMENGVATGKKAQTENGLLQGCAWDIKIDLNAFWEQVERLMKDEHTPIIHFCNTRFGFELIKSKENWFRYDLIWNKSKGVGFLLANKMPMRSHENIYVFSKKGANYYRKDITGDFKSSYNQRSQGQNVYGNIPMPEIMPDNTGKRCVKSVIDMSSTTRKGNHPTQKPDDLYAFLIERYSKEGDTILDPTAGSFASVFTAERLNRKGIGIEMNEEFFKKAQDKSA
jgi:site-specific DNA-methyltransferase (adenine-specific)